MAKAPTPGASKRREAAAAVEQVLTITIKREIVTAKGRVLPDSHTLAVNLLPMRERLICRKATGLPFEAYWGETTIGMDSIVVLWWLARRANGEVTLTFDAAVSEWPVDLDPDDFDLSLEGFDDEADDPEA